MCTTSPTLEEDQGGSPISTTSGVCHHDVTSRRDSPKHHTQWRRMTTLCKCSTGSHRDASRSRFHLACRSWWQYWPHRPIHTALYSDSWSKVFSDEILHWCFTDHFYSTITLLWRSGWLVCLVNFVVVPTYKSHRVVSKIFCCHDSQWSLQQFGLFNFDPVFHISIHLCKLSSLSPSHPSLCLLIQKRVRQSPGLPALSMSIPRPKRSVATRMRFWNSLNCLYLPGMMLNDAKRRQAIGGWRAAEVDSQHVKLRRREE